MIATAGDLSAPEFSPSNLSITLAAHLPSTVAIENSPSFELVSPPGAAANSTLILRI